MANEIELRVKALETWKGTVMVDIAVDAERRKHMDKRFDELEVKIDTFTNGIKSTINKVLLGLVLLVTTEAARFILGGGLASVTG